METIQPSISGWKDKQNMVYPYNGVLFDHENESSTTWKKLENIMLSKTKEHILYDSIYLKCPE